MAAAGLVTRKSSDLLAVEHGGVARSLRYIWEHSHEPISVKNLVNQVISPPKPKVDPDPLTSEAVTC